MTSVGSLSSGSPRLGVVRCAAVGAILFGLAFVSCWIAAAFTDLIGSHMYISLFTVAPVGSLEALTIGTGVSVGVGALVGMIGAAAYNALGFLSPR